MNGDLLGLVHPAAGAHPLAGVHQRRAHLLVGLHHGAQLRGRALVSNPGVADEARGRVGHPDRRAAHEGGAAGGGAGALDPLNAFELAPEARGAGRGAAEHLAHAADLAREIAGLVARAGLLGAQAPELLPMAVRPLVRLGERVADPAGPLLDAGERAADARADLGPDDDPDPDVVRHQLRPRAFRTARASSASSASSLHVHRVDHRERLVEDVGDEGLAVRRSSAGTKNPGTPPDPVVVPEVHLVPLGRGDLAQVGEQRDLQLGRRGAGPAERCAARKSPTSGRRIAILLTSAPPISIGWVSGIVFFSSAIAPSRPPGPRAASRAGRRR